jgi:thioesterase domain-containing protein
MSKICTIDDLNAIWKRVLNRRSIKPDDNFFELGGTPELAIKLFCELGELCHRELSPIMIFQAPTIRDMSSLLQNSNDPLPCPHLLLVRPGTRTTPIFLAHGIGGDATQLFEIARNLQVSSAVYATQAPGIDATSKPLDSIEEMAAIYFRAIKSVQPQGPYFLIGYSFGGLVMMEIAQRLRAEGESIAFLAMLDTYPHRTRLSWKQRFPLLTRLAIRRLTSMARYFKNRRSLQPVKSPIELARERVHSAESIAWRRYRPRFYSGNIYFLKAEITSCYPKNPRAVWAPLVNQFELRTVPGDHTAMVTTQYKMVADLLTEQLRWRIGRNASRAV